MLNFFQKFKKIVKNATKDKNKSLYSPCFHAFSLVETYLLYIQDRLVPIPESVNDEKAQDHKKLLEARRKMKQCRLTVKQVGMMQSSSKKQQRVK